MTLNQTSTDIANYFNQSSNHEFKERVKDMVKQELAMWIRRSVAEHGIDDVLLISYVAQVEEAKLHNHIPDSLVTVKRTKYRVPTPVRFNNDAPFTYVGSIDKLNAYPIRNASEAALMHLYSSTGVSYSYYLSNGYIIINDKPDNSFKSEYILIESIFENPEEVLSMYDDVDGQDIQLPIPLDIIALMRDKIIQRLGGIRADDINVELNDKPNGN
jgi:hypothetical protein